MEAIIQEVKDLYARSDGRHRAEIQRDIYRLQGSLYSGFEFMIHLVANGPIKYAMAKIGVDLQIFNILHENEGPFTVSQLAERTAAAPELLKRLLRTQAALDLIDQTGPQTFQANRLTEFLANPDLNSLLRFQQSLFGPAYQALPDFLRARNYQMIMADNDTAFQMGFNTHLTFMEFLKQNPEHMDNVHKGLQQSEGKQWTDEFPVEENIGQLECDGKDRPLLVDIGGGRGQQAGLFKRRYPRLTGRIIVQDEAEVIKNAPAIEGVEFMVHDFFQPQPIQGARFYYLRFVLHDWPDDVCVKILQAIIPAMAPDSRIILDEMVTSDLGMSRWAAVLDTAMLSICGGMERSKEDWSALLERAGLKMLEVREYDPENLSVIVAAPYKEKGYC